MKKKINFIVGGLVAAVIATAALAQTVTSGFFPQWPIYGGASYSCGTVNGVSNCTVPAGPTVTTGQETIPVNTGLSGGQTPQNAYIGLASLGAMPIAVQAIVPASGVAGATAVSATNLSGGILYTSPSTITLANVTLPLSPINKQTYVISSNRTITTLTVNAAAGASMGGNTAPTVLTASTTGPQSYKFFYNAADTSWYRLQ